MIDPFMIVLICVGFTLYGYVWGRGNRIYNLKTEVTRIVTATMDSLEREGYLKSKMLNGELHYIKWSEARDADKNTDS